MLKFIIKTHVRGFFDTDLHEVSWHFATHEAVRPSGFYVQLTEWRSVSKKPFKMGFCFYLKLRMHTQPLNSLKTVSKFGDLSSTIAMTAHCFGALSRVRAIGHCVIGQERDLHCPDWLNWCVRPWAPAFEIRSTAVTRQYTYNCTLLHGKPNFVFPVTCNGAELSNSP